MLYMVHYVTAKTSGTGKKSIYFNDVIVLQ